MDQEFTETPSEDPKQVFRNEILDANTKKSQTQCLLNNFQLDQLKSLPQTTPRPFDLMIDQEEDYRAGLATSRSQVERIKPLEFESVSQRTKQE